MSKQSRKDKKISSNTIKINIDKDEFKKMCRDQEIDALKFMKNVYKSLDIDEQEFNDLEKEITEKYNITPEELNN